jgi:hypothetical protein
MVPTVLHVYLATIRTLTQRKVIQVHASYAPLASTLVPVVVLLVLLAILGNSAVQIASHVKIVLLESMHITKQNA